jgi:S-adenosylmethionine:tRNA ribosyltransferase-isomerase
MIAASRPIQRPRDAKLLVVDVHGRIRHAPRSALVRFLNPGDLVVANDAATLPASLTGVHLPTGEAIELRLAGRRSLAVDDVRQFSAVVFGAGDFHTRTEDRPDPPRVAPGDRLQIGPLAATVERLLGHPRLVSVRFAGSPDTIWAGLASHGRPIQYTHVPHPLALWDVWTPIAGPPVAFEPPSAGFALDWATLAGLHHAGAEFATITHAAGISSTGDAALDRRLPLDEPYSIPESTVYAIRRAQACGGRIIAIGTTVVRALEHAASRGPIRAGEALATQRLGPHSRLRVVDAIVSGTHEPGSSHYELLRAFTGDDTLRRASEELEAAGYRTHEFGDSIWIERMSESARYSKMERCQIRAAVSSAVPRLL